MAKEIGYNDSVARYEGAHTGDGSGEDLKWYGPHRKEYATPGHEGRSETTTPIGPQSGFAPLGEADGTPHGTSDILSDKQYRREWGQF